MTPILPGSAVGVLGSGQLGRMFAIAARRMGYRVHTLSPKFDTPTGQVADVGAEPGLAAGGHELVVVVRRSVAFQPDPRLVGTPGQLDRARVLAAMVILLVLVGTWHSQLGLQVVIGDYLHAGTKTLILVLVSFLHVLIAVAGVFAILKVAFGGAS